MLIFHTTCQSLLTSTAILPIMTSLQISSILMFILWVLMVTGLKVVDLQPCCPFINDRWSKVGRWHKKYFKSILIDAPKYYIVPKHHHDLRIYGKLEKFLKILVIQW